LLAEILRFNREASKLLASPDAQCLQLGDYLRAQRFSEDFKRYYLYPMASAVWSTALDEIDEFPALTLVRFFDNHGFLGLDTHPQWYVLRGGSQSYIAPLTTPYRERIHLSARINSVTRGPDGVHLRFADRPTQHFDEVVFACHAPQALALLADANPLERAILGSFKTSRNEALLHTDANLLPRRPAARASWNYHLGRDPRRVAVTYHLNRLQNLPVAETYCLTLNLPEAVDGRKVLRAITYYHPLVTLDAVRAQTRWSEISGRRRAHFCGAYWFYGFHEDGLNSAIRVAESLNAPGRAADADGFRDLRRNAAASAVSSSAA
jgi:predicted NAD/FAD-binding protein